MIGAANEFKEAWKTKWSSTIDENGNEATNQ